MPIDLSIVVPVRNEAENVAPLVAEIRSALDGLLDYEIVYVDDGSADETASVLREVAAGFPRLRFLRHAASCGQSAAIRTEVRAARGTFIATIDGDGQNDPADIPALWALRGREDRLLVGGKRMKRKDTWRKRAASRVANGVRAFLLGDRTPDTGCGLKLLRRDLFLDLPYFDHMHRFMPALVLREGGSVVSIAVNHRPRLRGRSNYGVLDRLAVGLTDLLGMMWLQRRARRPAIVEER